MPVSPRKLVIELRYKPELRFYGSMDGAASGLSDHYADWERSPLTVEIRNKKRHRRIFIASRRCFFESDLRASDNLRSEFEHANTDLASVSSKIEVKEFTRIGTRQWFAIGVERPFEFLVDTVAKRFLSQDEQLSAILSDDVQDVAYGVDYKTSDGWKYHLRLGPMTKEQWFENVAYERGIYEAPDADDKETFSNYKDSFPLNFLYVDLDCYAEDVTAKDLSATLTSFRRRSEDVVGKLVNYCKGS